MPLLDDAKTIVLTINESSDHLAVLDVVPNNVKSKSEARKLLKQAQIDLAKLLNKIQ